MEVARSQIADEILGYLRDAISVNVVGLRQSGRTCLVRRVTDRLREDDVTVVAINGVAVLRDRPLSGLALAGVKIPSETAASALSAMVAALAKLLPPRTSVLVIDDADDLDPVSAGAIVAAHMRQRFPVLSVTRPGGRRQAASRALTAQLQPGVRITLDPLGFAQLHHFVHQLLPGPVDSSAIAQIATLSGGLPGLVGAIVTTGRRDGRIAQDHAVWQIRNDLWNDRLAPAVEPLLADLCDEELDALAALSVRRIVSVGEARTIVPDRMFARLHELGLLQVAQIPADPLVGVFPPLLAEYLRRTAAVTAQPETADVAETGSGVGLESPAPRLSLTSSRAAILNTRIAEYWQVEVDALRLAWRADPSAENAVPLLAALHGASAEPADLATVIADTRPDDANPLWCVLFTAWKAICQTFVHDDLDGACEFLRAERLTWPAYASHLRVAEAGLRLLAGSIPDAELLAPAGPDEEPLGAEGLEAMRIATLVAQGRTVDALAALPGFAPTDPSHVEQYRVSVGLARVLHGDLDDGVEWALRAMTDAEDALHLGEIHAHAYVAALGLTFSGRLSDLDALLGPVLTLKGTTFLHRHYQAGTLALAALAASWHGRFDMGWSLTVQGEAIGRHPGPFPGMVHGVTPIPGDPGGSRIEVGARLWRGVQERLASGYIAAGVALAITAVEILADAEQAEVVAEHARNTQSPLLAAFGAYVAASASGDPDLLAATVDDLWARGVRVHAIKAAVTRSLALRGRGQIEASVKQAERAWARATELGQGYRGLFFRLGRAVDLTAREREVALLVAQGMATQAIAALLSLSARTVENYVFSAYRKLGVEGREDLVRAVSTWAALE